MSVTTTPNGNRVRRQERHVERPVLYRCKRCRRTVRRVYPVRIVTRYYELHDHAAGTSRERRDVQAVWPDPCPEGPPLIPCEGCGRHLSGSPVRAIHNPEIQCGAKCRNAVGPQCECSCRGKNHGRNH